MTSAYGWHNEGPPEPMRTRHVHAVLGAVRIAEQALGIAEFAVADAMREGLWGEDQP